MPEPVLTSQATAAIDEYVLRIARRSDLPFASAEDARRELAAHVRDLAHERARAKGDALTDATHVRLAIEALGSETGVLAAFFPSVESRADRFPWGRALLLMATVFAGFATVYSLLVTLQGIDFQLVPVLLITLAAALFGSAAVWTLPARWSIVAAAVVLTLPLLVYSAAGYDDNWLVWLLPAMVIVAGGVLRTQVANGNRPTGHLPIDLERLTAGLVREWRRVGRFLAAAVTVFLATAVFAGFLGNYRGDEWPGYVAMLAASLFGVFALGRLRFRVPFALACAQFLAAFVLAEFYEDLRWLEWAMPAAALGLGSVFVAAFPGRTKPEAGGARPSLSTTFETP